MISPKLRDLFFFCSWKALNVISSSSPLVPELCASPLSALSSVTALSAPGRGACDWCWSPWPQGHWAKSFSFLFMLSVQLTVFIELHHGWIRSMVWFGLCTVFHTECVVTYSSVLRVILMLILYMTPVDFPSSWLLWTSTQGDRTSFIILKLFYQLAHFVGLQLQSPSSVQSLWLTAKLVMLQFKVFTVQYSFTMSWYSFTQAYKNVKKKRIREYNFI